MSCVKGAWSLGTWGQVAFGLGGLAVSFGAPKLLAQTLKMDSLQNGWGGVVTSGVSGTLVSGLVCLVSRSAGSSMLVGSLMGTALMGLSAILGGPTRAKFIPIEEALLAASLPSGGSAPQTPQLSGAAAGIYQGLLAAGQTPDGAMSQLKAMGLADYYSPRALPMSKTGTHDYYAGPPAARSRPDYFVKAEKF